MLNKKLAALPLALALAYALILTVFFSGWTWALYDELHWLEKFDHGSTMLSFFKADYDAFSRVRPLSAGFNFAKFIVFGTGPHALRVVRVLEFALAMGLAFAFLRGRGVALLFAAVGVGFWIKSPPQLEQLRWMTMVELPGIILVLCALLIRRRSRALSYAFLVAALLTKEPFLAFLALPAVLDKKWREALIAGGVTVAYAAFLFLNRKSYTAESAVTEGAIHEIVRGGALDFIALVPLFYFGRRIRLNTRFGWSALTFTAFGAAYLVLIFSKTWGYTYILAPTIFCFSMAIAFALAAMAEKQKLPRIALLFVCALAALFPLRLCWNWTKVYARSKPRAELIDAINRSGVPGRVGTNCYIDARGLGYAAGKRNEGTPCPEADLPFSKCCQNSALLALGSECPNYELRVEQATKTGLTSLYSNGAWHLFKCP